MSASNDTIIRRYEEKVEMLEREKALIAEKAANQSSPQGTFEEKLEPALKFLANPWKLWESGNITLRRLVLKLAFIDHIAYCRNEGPRGGGRVWVATPHNNEETAVSGNGNMVGFACETKAEVDTAHRIALEQGGTNEGNPGPRPMYGPDFYGAYVRDLDGNKMSFVHLGESQQ